jgi:hypothetical protein
MLLKAGTPVEEPGWMPFMAAVAEKRFEIAGELVRSRANINATDWRGQTVFSGRAKNPKTTSSLFCALHTPMHVDHRDRFFEFSLDDRELGIV